MYLSSTSVQLHLFSKILRVSSNFLIKRNYVVTLKFFVRTYFQEIFIIFQKSDIHPGSIACILTYNYQDEKKIIFSKFALKIRSILCILQSFYFKKKQMVETEVINLFEGTLDKETIFCNRAT